MNNSGRLLPQKLEIERTVLGAMICSKESTAIGIDQLVDVDCFYVAANKLIFNAIKYLFTHNKPVEIESISDYLKGRGELDPAGGDCYLVEVSESICTAKNLPYYIDILNDYRERRKGIEVADKTKDSYFEDDESSASDISSRAISSILELRNIKKSKIVRFSDVLPETFEWIDNVHTGKKAPADIKLEYPSLDNNLFITNGDLIIIGGRPSMGKTSVAGCFYRNIALSGKTVMVFNFESSNKNEVKRNLFSQAKISLYQFNAGKVPHMDLPNLSHVAGPLANCNIFYDSYSMNTPAKMYASCLQVKHEVGRLDSIFVDFLQIVKPDNRMESRRVEVGYISKQLKHLAEHFNVPIFVLSQLSRPERGVVKAPTLADLRESGEIEQNADIVLLLHRPEYYMKYADALKKGVVNEMHVIIAKNKNGPPGYIKMAYIKEFMRLEEMSDREDEEMDKQQQLSVFQNG